MANPRIILERKVKSGFKYTAFETESELHAQLNRMAPFTPRRVYVHESGAVYEADDRYTRRLADGTWLVATNGAQRPTRNTYAQSARPMFYALDKGINNEPTLGTEKYGYREHGTLHIFDRKSDRDEWVNASCVNGGSAAQTRIAISGDRKRARHFREDRGYYTEGYGYHVTHSENGNVVYWHRGYEVDATHFAG